MSAPKHTPGPWKPCRRVEDFKGFYWDMEPDEKSEYEKMPFVKIVSESGISVANAHDLFEFDPANARLIAAAPDLLEACNLLEALFSSRVIDEAESVAIDKARDAIFKATREQA